MKLRIANKILKAIGDGDTRHTGLQLTRALRRVERTKESKAAEAFWRSLMLAMSPSDRAVVLPPGMAFEHLMSHKEEDWDKPLREIQ